MAKSKAKADQTADYAVPYQHQRVVTGQSGLEHDPVKGLDTGVKVYSRTISVPRPPVGSGKGFSGI